MNKIPKFFFWLFLVSLPFGYRLLIFRFTPGFDEYEAIFLYASDVLMILFLLNFSAKTFPQDYRSNPQRGFFAGFRRSLFPTSSENHARSLLEPRFEKKFLLLFLIFLFISILFASYKLLALYNFIRLVLLVLTALAVAEILKRNWVKLENILAVLAGLAVFQSLVAFLQFLNQKSLGFWFLGESVLGPEISGVAKIAAAGGKILRAYGTFPHPNVLAAFLLLGLFCSYYCFLKVLNRERSFWLKFSSIAAISAISLGLVLTFSRTAWFLGLVLTPIFIFYLFRQKYSCQKFNYFSVILIFIFLILVLGLGYLIFPRAQIYLSEPSVVQRISYNELGWHLIKTHPLGVGLGNQVVYSVENGLYGLFGISQVWQWQPIHNIYLLIGSEIGILGLLVFLFFLANLLISNYKFLISNKTSISNEKNFGNCPDFVEDSRLCRRKLEIGNLTIMLLLLLLFGLFDHFLWTLQPGRLMLWLVLGIIMGIKTPCRSMDRTQASEA